MLSKKNTHVTQATVTKPQLQGSVQVPSYLFDDLMMATYRKSQSVEQFFRGFARVVGQELFISKEDFTKAIEALGLEWPRSDDIYHALAQAVSIGRLQPALSPSDLG